MGLLDNGIVIDESGNIRAGYKPGLLDDLANYTPGYDYGTILPYRINQKTKQREFAAPGFIKDMARAITAPERAYYGLLNDPQQQAMEANNFGLNLLGSGVGTSAAVAPVNGAGTVGHTVWHGSPHKFDKFDMSKIGTGEGAQAYGHGLYFAEHPATAGTYASKLSNGGAMPMPPRPYDFLIDNARYVKNDNGLFKQLGNSADYIPVKKDEYGDALRKAQTSYDEKLKNGQLYKVDIPDEILPKMLDWDKPLSQQYPDVQATASKVLSPMANAYSTGPLAEPIGKFLERSPHESFALQKAGIPGIRYLDGNSRGAGNGSYNYVIFDDTLPRILERNGIPTGQQPWPSLLK